MFSKKIKLVPEQYKILEQLEKDMNLTKKDVAYNLIEIGIMTLISARKLTIDGKDGLSNLADTLNKEIQNDESYLRMSQLLEKYWNADQKK